MKWSMRMLSKTKKERHGFTLIELMVVLIIIAILAVAAVPTYMYFVHRAYESEAAASLGAIKTAQLVYYAEHNYYTYSWADLGLTSGDVTQNKWFNAGTFGLDPTVPTSDFTAVCDGSQTGGDPKVVDIQKAVTSTSDIRDATAAEISNVAPPGDWGPP